MDHPARQSLTEPPPRHLVGRLRALLDVIETTAQAVPHIGAPSLELTARAIHVPPTRLAGLRVG